MARHDREQANRVRVAFHEGDGADPLTSLWATKSSGESGSVVLTLECEHPDFKPAPGWCVTGRNLHLEVVSVDGPRLTCRPHAVRRLPILPDEPTEPNHEGV